MTQRSYIIGRKGDIKVTAASVSRRHARLQIDEAGCYLVDLNSSNGTYRVQGGTRTRFREGAVQLGETFAFGDCVFTIQQLLDRCPGQMTADDGPGKGRMAGHASEPPGARIRCAHCGRVLLAHLVSCPHCGQVLG